MKNLENFGVQELNSLESKEIDGGFLLTLPLFAFAWGYAYEKYVVQ